MTSRGLLVAGSWTAACLKGTGADTSGTFSARRLACATATCGQQAECHLSAALLQGASPLGGPGRSADISPVKASQEAPQQVDQAVHVSRIDNVQSDSMYCTLYGQSNGDIVGIKFANGIALVLCRKAAL